MLVAGERAQRGRCCVVAAFVLHRLEMRWKGKKTYLNVCGAHVDRATAEKSGAPRMQRGMLATAADL